MPDRRDYLPSQARGEFIRRRPERRPNWCRPRSSAPPSVNDLSHAMPRSMYTPITSVTVNVVLPEGALSVLRTGPTEFAEELKRAAVSKWYEVGMVSQSKGAEILGISRSEFLDVLSRYRVSPFQVDEDELATGPRHG